MMQLIERFLDFPSKLKFDLTGKDFYEIKGN